MYRWCLKRFPYWLVLLSLSYTTQSSLPCMWDTRTFFNPCPHLNTLLVNMIKLWYGWVNTSHTKQLMYYIVHPKIWQQTCLYKGPRCDAMSFPGPGGEPITLWQRQLYWKCNGANEMEKYLDPLMLMVSQSHLVLLIYVPDIMIGWNHSLLQQRI